MTASRQSAAPDCSTESEFSQSDPPTITEPSVPCTPAELDHWARLLSGGDVIWPDDLPPELVEELKRRIGVLRRSQLVRLIARVVAEDLFRDHQSLEQNHDSV